MCLFVCVCIRVYLPAGTADTGTLCFSPYALVDMRALKGLACHARITPASSYASRASLRRLHVACVPHLRLRPSFSRLLLAHITWRQLRLSVIGVSSLWQAHFCLKSHAALRGSLHIVAKHTASLFRLLILVALLGFLHAESAHDHIRPQRVWYGPIYLREDVQHAPLLISIHVGGQTVLGG